METEFDAIDPKLSTAKWSYKRALMKAVMENDAQKLATAIELIPNNEMEACLWSCHGGHNILEWAMSKGFWNSAHLLVAYIYGISEEILQMIDYNIFTVGTDCWNSVFDKTIQKYQHGTGAVGQAQLYGFSKRCLPHFKQRMLVYRLAMVNNCFDIFKAIPKYPYTVLGLLALGADVRQRSDKNETLPAVVIDSTLGKADTIRLLDFFATLDPNINHEVCGEDNIPPSFLCMNDRRKHLYAMLKTDDDFKVVSATGKTILDYANDRKYFSKEDIIKILTFNLAALNSAVKSSFIYLPYLMEAIEIISNEGRQKEFSFTDGDFQPHLISFLVQLGFDSDIDAFVKAKKRMLLLPNKESTTLESFQGVFPIDLLPKEILHLIFMELAPLDAGNLSLTSKTLHESITPWEWRQIFAKNWPLKEIKQSDQTNWKEIGLNHHRVMNNWRKGKYEFQYLVSASLNTYNFFCDENWGIAIDYNSSTLFNCQQENKKTIVMEHSEFFNNNNNVPEMFDHVIFLNSDPNPDRIPSMLALNKDHSSVFLLHDEYENHQLTVINALPAIAYTQSCEVSFMKQNQHYVIGPRMHTIDLTTRHVISSLPENYSMTLASPNLFDQCRTSVAFDRDSFYIFDANSAVINQFDYNKAHEAVIRQAHMIDEHTLLAVTSNSRVYYDIRFSNKEIEVIEEGLDLIDSVVFDIANHRMAYSSPQRIIVVIDLNSGLIERVLRPLNDAMRGSSLSAINTHYLFLLSGGGVTYLDFNR